MRRTSLLAAAALALAPLAAAPAPAHADQTFTGTVTAADPVETVSQPEDATQACSFTGGASATVPVDTVTLPANIAGVRNFVLTSNAGASMIVLYAYRNGVCVGADYIADNAAEQSAGIIDVEGIPYAAGDTITVKIAANPGPVWSLNVIQPEPVKGSPATAVVGAGSRFVRVPDAISCADQSAVLRFNKRAKNKAKKAVVRVDGQKRKQVTVFRPGRKVAVAGIPATARTLTVVLTLKNGRKVSVSRSYWPC